MYEAKSEFKIRYDPQILKHFLKASKAIRVLHANNLQVSFLRHPNSSNLSSHYEPISFHKPALMKLLGKQFDLAREFVMTDWAN